MKTHALSLHKLTFARTLAPLVSRLVLSGLLLLSAFFGAPAQADQLIATDESGHHARVYDAATGAFLYSLGSPQDGISTTYGVTVGPDGLLYVLSHDNNRIMQYDMTSRSFIQTYAGIPGYSLQQCLFDSKGHLNVLTNSQIKTDNGTGTLTDLLSTDPSQTLRPVTARDFAIGPDGNYYVVDQDAGDIKRYTPHGRSVDFANGKPVAFIPRGTNGLVNVYGLAFSPDGTLYIADYDNDRIVRYDSQSKQLVTFASGNGLHHPGRLRFGPNGDLYVIHYPDGLASGIQQWRVVPGHALGAFVKNVVTENNTFLYYLTFTHQGDVNADGNTDLLFQNAQTGEAAVWYMQGKQFAGEQSMAPALGGQWRIEATADLGANGNTDLIWRNTQTGDVYYWQMSGVAIHGYGLIAYGLPLNWHLVGAGDFNGDGYPDLVWQDSVTGQAAVWYMSGTQYLSWDTLPSYGAQWQIAAVADFNNDGTPDLLWRNGSDGRVSLGFMQGTALLRSDLVFNGGALDWQIVGTGDMNHDGYADILWQNAQTGAVSVWYMHGSAYMGGEQVASVPWPWRLAGPR